MSRRRSHAFVAVVALSSLSALCFACSTRAARDSASDAPDGGHEAPAPIVASASDELHARLATYPAFAHLAQHVALQRAGGAFVARTPTLTSTLPSAAHAPAHLVTTRGAFVDVRALDVSPSAVPHADVVAGSVAFRDVAPLTDVLFAATPEGFEELRVLRDAAASSALRWSIHVSDGASFRVREGIAELVDPGGRVALAAARPFAVDARGVRRELAFTLAGDTLSASLDRAGLAYPIVVDPFWTTTGPMVTPRTSAAFATLPSGKVVMLGGQSLAGPLLSTVEIYDPVANTWSSAGTTTAPHTGSVAVVLTAGASTGKVFVSGGTFASDLYDPVAQTSVSSAPAPITVTTMSGAGSKAFAFSGAAARVWDSATSAWSTPTGTFTARAAGWSSTSLGDGRVVILGGSKTGVPGTSPAVDIYRPTTNDFVAGTSGAAPSGHAAVLLAGGTKIAAIGGQTTDFKGVTSTLTSAAIYDSVADGWTFGIPMISARPAPVAALLPNGKVVIAGGGTASVEVLDPTTNTIDIGVDAPTASVGTAAYSTSLGALFLPTRYLYDPGQPGVACAVGFECMSGNCVNGACCTTSACSGGAVCNTATKAGTCTKPNGVACAASSECELGHCVDGVCCDGACGSECQACDVPGKVGTCSPVYGPVHGVRAACPGASGSDVCQRQICNGVDVAACHFAPALTVPCGGSACSSGIETHPSSCDGAGKCSDVPRSCGAYVCGSPSCKSSCAANADCVAGYYCDVAKSACVPQVGLGAKCASASMCGGGLFCTEGVCCGVASCGAAATCAAPGHEGTCRKSAGQSCTIDDECGTGSCADGVCCDSACTGQCEACDVAGSIGKCTPASGHPHGARPACPHPTSVACPECDACTASACDGAERGRCAALPGSETECRAKSCKGDTLTARALCDGTGVCPTATQTSCGGYRCDETAGACKTTCSADTDCAAGFACSGGACAKVSSFCSDDGLSVVDATGAATSCAPYRCKDGHCRATCASTDECSGGTVCSVTTGTCDTPAATDGGSQGGCTLAGAGEGASGGTYACALALGLAWVMARARRR
jgi:hypothetical protein